MNIRIFSICMLISLLFPNNSNSQRNRYDNSCLTSRNEAGVCINLKQCNYMSDLLQTKSGNPEVATYLRTSQCGYDGRVPKVCCPTQPAPIPVQPVPYPSQTYPVSTGSSDGGGLLPTQNCGKQSVGSGTKVVGGRTAELGAWPWIAALGYRHRNNPGPEWYCGSTLINNRYVVTAAHCIIGTAPWTLYLVRLGDLNLDDSEQDGATPVDIEVDRSITHERYSSSPVTNDIALVRLRRAVQFTPLIQPVCLPLSYEFRTNSFVNQNVFVAGWGRLKFSGPFSPALQDLLIPIIDNAVCKRSYSRLQGANVDNRVICAGTLSGGKDTCQGDSGGPLVYDNNDKFYLLGIVSYGFRCAEVGYPGLYTRVSEYIDWITSHVTN